MANTPKTGENMPQAPKDPEKASGPKRGPKGEYLPSEYKTQRGNIRKDN